PHRHAGLGVTRVRVGAGVIGAALLASLLVAPTAGAATAPAPAAPVAAATPSAASLPRVPPPADLPRERPLRAGFLVLDGVYGTELVAAHDVLQPTVLHTRPGIDTFPVSPDGGTVKTAEGLVIAAKYSLSSAPAIDILVVPSGEHAMDSDLGNEALI